jgi:hypothetical protein
METLLVGLELLVVFSSDRGQVVAHSENSPTSI